ncbi:DUF937 domain-containing protein [Rhizobium sp. YS-1r]|uniref:DUF937 domain-containing protein n=1 Tax=Neorhizobium phenanthreniclasticum TaxID=3157917 RepID=A0ABV0LVF9_9HYPH|nr:DUF937 domain-containing protein [Rhizobium sp. YS-1r]KGD86180.1 hypothetical protein JL39_28880 [Rhizobium sp. YS-1r]
MLPLFDVMLRAQNGEGMEAIAKQFNLAQEQATQAMAALMPAFSSGLKRSATNPYDLTALMSSMFSGAYTKYFEDMTKAFTPQGVADGNAVLEKIFGSKEVSRAIAAQAEQFTGIAQDTFKRMMPVMADTLMGGLFKQMTGQMPTANEAFAASPIGQMAQQWLESMGLQPKTKPQAAINPFDNPFTQAMRSMWGLDKPEQPQPPSSSNPFADNPFAKAFQDMMAGAFPSQAPSAPAPEKPTEKPAPEANPYRDVLNSMFDSGLEVQKTYQKNMEAIFATLRNGADDKPTPAETTPGK